MWQASRKSICSIKNGRAPISLELLASAGRVSYQVHLSKPVAVEVTKALLPGHFAGHELVEGGRSWWEVYGLFLIAWQVHIAAMMVPSSLPLVLLFGRVSQSQPAPRLALGGS